MRFLYQFARWDVIALLIAIAIVFWLEMLGVFDSRYVTITGLVRQYVPVWARVMILSWLCYHFLIAKP